MEVLVRVDTSLLRRCPGRRVHARGNLTGVIFLLPSDQHCDGILGTFDAAQTRRDAFRGRGGYFDGNEPLLRDHGVADVDVVAVQVVRDVGVDACPGFEGLELRLGLRHVAVEVVEVAQLLRLVLCVGVRRIEALVMLDVHVNAGFLSRLDE